MIHIKGYNSVKLSAHSQLGVPYLELEFETQRNAEDFYEEVKKFGFKVPNDIDLKMNEDESLGLTTVILDWGALMEINEPAQTA